MASKPTVAVFVGAFHLSSTLDLLLNQLQAAGYPTRTSTLRSVDNAAATVQDDVDMIREEILEPLLADGKDVVVALHSFAGLPGSAAIKGLGKQYRQTQSSLPGGIIGLIYMCAFIPHEGQTLHLALGDQWTPWQSPDDETGLLMVPDPKPVFYADVAEPTASEYAALVKGHSIKAMLSPTPPIGYNDAVFDGRRAYIRTPQDAAIPNFVQDGMIQASGADWIIKDIVGGHSPFLAKPAETARVFVELTNIFLDVQ